MLVDPVRRFFDEKVDSKKIDRESKVSQMCSNQFVMIYHCTIT